MVDYQGVLVFAETVNCKATSTAKELLGIGRKLANALGERLGVLLIGSSSQTAGEEAIALGADTAYLVTHPLLAEYHPDFYTIAIVDACKQIMPSIFLLGQDDIGRDIAPRIAARLGTSLSMDCIELSIDPNTRLLLQRRPVFGGKATAVLVSECCRPQMVTVRPRAMMPAEPDDSRQGETVNIQVELDRSTAKSSLISTEKEEIVGIKLEDAKVVVAGGRGIGSAEGFHIINELAKILGGAIGASRAPCDEGWIPSSHKIGQTGKIVQPNLYIAVGISGAPQHLSGCLDSKWIVAINTDPGASIFEVSDFKLVADYKEALPALIHKCKEILTS